VRVLQLHNRQTGVGGADAVIEREADLLRADGHEVDQLFVSNEQLSELSPIRAGLKAVWNAEACRALDRALAEFTPQIVHVHTPFPLMSPAVFRIAHRRGAPTVTTVHAFRYSCVAGTCHRDGLVCEACIGSTTRLPAVRHRCYKQSAMASAALASGLVLHRTLRTFSRRVARYVTLTDFMREMLVRDGFPPDRVVVKPNFVADPGPTDPSAPRTRFVYVGRLTPYKGVGTLLAAWALMPDPPPLTIIGDGEMRSQVEAAAGASGAITFRGWIDPGEVLEALRDARYLVLPSEWYEAGFPLVGIEAFACGTPVIASDVGNFSEAVDPGVDGWRFRSADPASLAAVVEAAAGETDDSQRRVGARHRYERSYTPERNLEMLLRIYREAGADVPPAAASTGTPR
jgi:glycosyltransferase involved in cell wall biosynthesis